MSIEEKYSASKRQLEKLPDIDPNDSYELDCMKDEIEQALALVRSLPSLVANFARKVEEVRKKTSKALPKKVERRN